MGSVEAADAEAESGEEFADAWDVAGLEFDFAFAEGAAAAAADFGEAGELGKIFVGEVGGEVVKDEDGFAVAVGGFATEQDFAVPRPVRLVFFGGGGLGDCDWAGREIGEGDVREGILPEGGAGGGEFDFSARGLHPGRGSGHEFRDAPPGAVEIGELPGPVGVPGGVGRVGDRNFEVSAVGDGADRGGGDACGSGGVEDVAQGIRFDAHDDAGLGFVEERDVGTEGRLERDGCAERDRAEAGLRESNGEATFRAVMRAADESACDEGAERAVEDDLVVEVNGGRGAFLAVVEDFEVMGAAQAGGGAGGIQKGAEEENGMTWRFEFLSGDVIGGFDEADHANDGGGIHCSGGAFVVEAHVAASDGGIEDAAGFRHAFDGFANLEEDGGFVGVAEIEVIRGGEGDGTGAGEVAGGFGHGDFRAFAGVEFAVDAVAVGCGGENFIGFADEEDGCVRARRDGCAEADHVVVLTPDPGF